MPNNDYILRSDALKAILGVSIYDTIEELEGARTIAENTWADGLWDAYKIIEEEVDAADVEPKKKWIPVTERLPEEHEMVLCYTPVDDYMCVGFVRKYKWGGKTLLKWNIITAMRSTKILTKKVTHWMPLPELPKVKDDDK